MDKKNIDMNGIAKGMKKSIPAMPILNSEETEVKPKQGAKIIVGIILFLIESFFILLCINYIFPIHLTYIKIVLLILIVRVITKRTGLKKI